jgi:hypothetical protein
LADIELLAETFHSACRVKCAKCKREISNWQQLVHSFNRWNGLQLGNEILCLYVHCKNAMLNPSHSDAHNEGGPEPNDMGIGIFLAPSRFFELPLSPSDFDVACYIAFCFIFVFSDTLAQKTEACQVRILLEKVEKCGVLSLEKLWRALVRESWLYSHLRGKQRKTDTKQHSATVGKHP